MNIVNTLSIPCPDYNKREILRYCGAKSDDIRLNSLIDECISEIDAKLKTLICYTEFNIRRCENGLDLGFCKTDSQLLKKHLKNCDKIILFSGTVGTEIDRYIMK